MTETAQRALPDIRAGLERLSLGLESLKVGGVRATLTVTVSPDFAAKWLLPRMHRFHTKIPDVDVRLETDLNLSNFAAQGIDVGVRYGAGHWPGHTVETRRSTRSARPGLRRGFRSLAAASWRKR
jgi:LysR family transcriptional regulator, glycine cleavage system transcriptional activator